MSVTIVRDIVDAFKSQIMTLLPDHAIATNIFEVEKNPFTNKKKLFGVRPLDATRNEDGPTRYLTIDQSIQVVFIDNYANINYKDEPQQEVVFKQHEYKETINSAVECGKLGLGGQVMHVKFESADEPEFFEELNLSVLRVTYTIKYRSII